MANALPNDAEALNYQVRRGGHLLDNQNMRYLINAATLFMILIVMKSILLP